MKVAEAIEKIQALLAPDSEITGAEVCVHNIRHLSLEIRSGSLLPTREENQVELGLRIQKGAKAGRGLTQNLEWESLRKLIEDVRVLCDSNASQTGLPAILPLEAAAGERKVADFVDPTFAQIGTDEKVNRLLNLESTALRQDAKILRVDWARYDEHNRTEDLWTLGSQRGLTSSHEVATLGIAVRATDSHVEATGEESQSQTSYNDIDWTQLAKGSAHTALRMLVSRPLTSGKYKVLFSNAVAWKLVSWLGTSLSADRHQIGQVSYRTDVGRSIFSEQVNLADDPFLGKGEGRCDWDAEGTPVSRVALVAGGRLLTLFHSRQSALNFQVPNTASTVRPAVGKDPCIGFHSFHLEPSSKDVVDLIREMQRGIMVHRIMDSSKVDLNSGSLDLEVEAAWYEGAEWVHGVRNLRLKTDLNTLFLRVLSVGRDLKMVGSSGSPSFLCDELNFESFGK